MGCTRCPTAAALLLRISLHFTWHTACLHAARHSAVRRGAGAAPCVQVRQREGEQDVEEQQVRRHLAPAIHLAQAHTIQLLVCILPLLSMS